jgi:glycine dehydrogenase
MNLFHDQQNEFTGRHIGTVGQEAAMLQTIGEPSIETLIDKTVPPAIRAAGELNLPAAVSEAALLQELKAVSLKNKVYKSYIGQGY